MLEKAILIVFAIIGASFLYGLVTPTPIAEPMQAQEELIDAGRFVVEQGGKQLLEESYTLFFTAEEGYMLVSQTRAPALEDGVTLAQQYQLDPGFTPITYHVAVDASSGLQIVSAQWSNLLVHMEILTGEGARSGNVLRTSNEVILDNNLISQYVLLILAMSPRLPSKPGRWKCFVSRLKAKSPWRLSYQSLSISQWCRSLLSATLLPEMCRHVWNQTCPAFGGGWALKR